VNAQLSSGTALAQWPGMLSDESPYYAEICIFVDGRPWQRSHFDFRRGLETSSLLEPAERMGETAPVQHAPAVFENRRVAQPSRLRRRQPDERRKRDKRRKHSRKAA
jgi:hypothetical protein